MLLIATKKHRYAGRVIQTGESFEARDKDAKVLIKVLKNSRKPDEPKAYIAPVTPVTVAESPTKRHYQRKDMTPAE